jgi:NADH-quinone oxidoreductase subunit N
MRSEWLVLFPAAEMMALGLAALMLDAFAPRGRDTRPAQAVLASIGLAAVGILLFMSLDAFLQGRASPRVVLGGAAVHDGFGTLLQALVWAAAASTVLFSGPLLARKGVPAGEFHGLLFLGASGMMLLAVSHDLMMIFLTLELFSLTLYVLAALPRDSARAGEGAMKYFVMGGAASALLLYGMALAYGATGRITLDALATGAGSDLLTAGVGLMLAGFAFKLGAVPFHMWVPDAYEGAPAAVTGFMASAVKAAAAAPLLRVVFAALPAIGREGGDVLWVLAAATMIVGNLAALGQTNLKRMLAFSAVAHTGYALTGLVGAGGRAGGDGAASVVMYLSVYAVMTLGSFGVLATLGRGGEDLETLEGCRGLSRRRPAAAAALTVFLISLAGIPPTAGFVSKYYVFKAAVEGGWIGLALVGVAGTLVSVYYYLRPVVAMYMEEAAEAAGRGEEGEPDLAVTLGLGAAVVLLFAIGIFPAATLDLAQRMAQSMP